MPKQPPSPGADETAPLDKDSRILDELTGIYSIEYFEHQMRSQISYALRHERPLSIVLFAIDHLDELTEGFGRQAADALLVRVAELVREHIRDEDVLARYGVGEFAVLCRETSIQPAGFLGTRIRQAVESAGLTHKGLELPITVSVGAAELSPKPEHSAVVQRAETALSRARVTGNCVILADD